MTTSSNWLLLILKSQFTQIYKKLQRYKVMQIVGFNCPGFKIFVCKIFVSTSMQQLMKTDDSEVCDTFSWKNMLLFSFSVL